MTVVDPLTITQLQLWSLGDELNHSQVVVPQSTSTFDGHSTNRSTVGISSTTNEQFSIAEMDDSFKHRAS
jgi:hypothetical protein